MKLIIKNILTPIIFTVLLLMNVSCLDNFEDINKNPLYPDKEMEQLDRVLNSAYLPNLQKHVWTCKLN